MGGHRGLLATAAGRIKWLEFNKWSISLCGLHVPKKPRSPQHRLMVTPSNPLANPNSFYLRPYPLTGTSARTSPWLSCLHSFLKAKSDQKWDCWIHVVVSFAIFGVTSMLFSIVLAPFCTPTMRAQGFQFLHILTNPAVFCFWYQPCQCVWGDISLGMYPKGLNSWPQRGISTPMFTAALLKIAKI